MLDGLACAAHDGRSYLMDDRYLGLLTDEERDMRSALLALRDSKERSDDSGRVRGRIDLLREEFGVRRPAIRHEAIS